MTFSRILKRGKQVGIFRMLFEPFHRIRTDGNRLFPLFPQPLRNLFQKLSRHTLSPQGFIYKGVVDLSDSVFLGKRDLGQ